MAYKTKPEKRAYRTGLLNGLRRLKKKRSKNKSSKKNTTAKIYKKKKNLSRRASRHKFVKRRIGGRARNDNPFGMTYMQFIREKEQQYRDLFGDFDYDSRGHIKGSYIDGRFEPD